MRVAIIGTGSIGSIIASALAITDVDLVLMARGLHGQALSTTGLSLSRPDGEMIHHSPERWVVTGEEIDEPLYRCADFAIICGKSNSTPILAQAAEQILKPNGIAISIQNGMGHAEFLVARLGKHRVMAGCTTHGAMRTGPGEVNWTGFGAIRLASLEDSDLTPSDSRVMGILDLLDDAELNPEWECDVKEMLWQKLLINVAINPLATICGVKNGELLARPDLHQQALEAMSEAAQVAAAEGVDLSLFDFETDLNHVLDATAGNRCSMLQDIMAGKPTEIESICGEVVRRGEELGIPTPLNQQLLTLIKGIEHSNRVS